MGRRGREEPDEGDGFWLDELTGELPDVDEPAPGYANGGPVEWADGSGQRPYATAPVGRAELRRSGKLEHRRARRRRIRGIVVLVALLSVVTGGAYQAYRLTERRPAAVQPGRPVAITVAAGEGSLEIGRALERAGVIDSAGRFRAVAGERGLDGALKPGTYQLETVMDVDSVIDVLVRGPGLGTSFTIPEGFTVSQVIDRIAATKRFSRASLEKTKSGAGLEVPFRPRGVKTLEGLLFPQTYRIEKDATAATVLQQMLDQLDRVMSGFDLAAAPRHLRPYQVLTVASMVEREAKVPQDRARIARVIYNRLAKGQPLQIDATVQYALGSAKPRLSSQDLQVRSRYNTYLHTGLPPTPIASPGQASIEAALKPASGPWLYYVLIDKDGHHAFTSSATEFARLKAEARRKGLL